MLELWLAGFGRKRLIPRPKTRRPSQLGEKVDAFCRMLPVHCAIRFIDVLNKIGIVCWLNRAKLSKFSIIEEFAGGGLDNCVNSRSDCKFFSKPPKPHNVFRQACFVGGTSPLDQIYHMRAVNQRASRGKLRGNNFVKKACRRLLKLQNCLHSRLPNALNNSHNT